MTYLIAKLWVFLLIALVAGIVTGWVTCRKRA